ncbi:MAG: hypothetical protein ABIO59_05495, partial [Luteimonas sp.]
MIMPCESVTGWRTSIPALGRPEFGDLRPSGRPAIIPPLWFRHSGWNMTARGKVPPMQGAESARQGTHSRPRMKTFSAKNETVQRDWYVVDAEGKTL